MSDSEDDLITYGTPLEPLEEDEIPNKKPRLLEDQIVTDKQGRRRFHGAFTGGFSAGFFNTVGSLEGWTPSSFKSSKSKKQELFQQKPEDFMDEEDVSEFGIAPVVLKARQDYTVGNNKFSDLPAFGVYAIHDILKPARETIGIKLLKKMGWKQGQGVGPRLKKSEKKKSLKMRQKIYGCELPPGLDEEESDSNSETEWDDITFAPNDYNPILCEARSNFCGLGYEGLDKRPVLSGNSLKKKEEKTKHESNKFGSQAFGVGAFEEEDEDIYEKDDMSRYNFFLGKDESADANKSAEKSSIVQDGVLDGFILETKTRPRKSYPLPKLPSQFKPYHKIRRSRFDQPPPSNSNEKVIKNPVINHENRRKLFEELSEEILEAERQKEIQTKKLISDVQITESKFKPFSSNPDKQERYENYLKLSKLGKKELLRDLQPLSMTNWDMEREKIEFEKAALLFKPLSGGMEDRFSSATQPDDLSDPLAVVEKYVDENDDRQKAARAKMYGPLTRKTEEWTPCALLCKRFNIPEPKKSHSQSVEKPKQKNYFNLFDSIQSLRENTEKTIKTEEPPPEKEKPKEEETRKEDEPKSDHEAEDQSATDIQDKTDLFKAIFLASDDEESPEETGENEKPAEDEQSNKLFENLQDDISYEEKIINSRRNFSPPKGIFKDIDLDSLSKGKAADTTKTEEIQTSKEDEPKESSTPKSLPEDLVYGPQIPEKFEAKASFFSGAVLDDDGVWVEKTNVTAKKHKKKDKKHKKSSHKSKHKHKKHKR